MNKNNVESNDKYKYIYYCIGLIIILLNLLSNFYKIQTKCPICTKKTNQNDIQYFNNRTKRNINVS